MLQDQNYLSFYVLNYSNILQPNVQNNIKHFYDMVYDFIWKDRFWKNDSAIVCIQSGTIESLEYMISYSVP